MPVNVLPVSVCLTPQHKHGREPAVGHPQHSNGLSCQTGDGMRREEGGEGGMNDLVNKCMGAFMLGRMDE